MSVAYAQLVLTPSWDRPVFLAGFGNNRRAVSVHDELGYMLPVDDFKFPWNPFRPGKHFEETNSIGKELASRLLDGLFSLL